MTNLELANLMWKEDKKILVCGVERDAVWVYEAAKKLEILNEQTSLEVNFIK